MFPEVRSWGEVAEPLRRLFEELERHGFHSASVLPLPGGLQHAPLDLCHVVRALQKQSNLFHRSAIAPAYRLAVRMGHAPALDLYDLFHLGRQVSQARVSRWLSAPLIHQLADAGVLERRGPGLLSRVLITPFQGMLYLSDPPRTRPEEHFVYMGRSSLAPLGTLLERLRPRTGGRLLDVGCGAGVLGISVAPAFDEAEGIDILERCLGYARLNAALNRQHNCRFYLSDLYENVEGSFDVIVSNPPCGWIDAEHEQARIFTTGGRDFGTQLPALVMRGGYDRLKPGGVLCCHLTAPVIAGRRYLDELLARVFGERPAHVTVYVLHEEFNYRRARAYRRLGISKIVRYLVLAQPAQSLAIRMASLDPLRVATYRARVFVPRMVAALTGGPRGESGAKVT